ncbi:hypothetical protein KY284_002564 [Solanum tuberosum]|nr:hypothetical protein KY284_002564 [Solanum tuberosum]
MEEPTLKGRNQREALTLSPTLFSDDVPWAKGAESHLTLLWCTYARNRTIAGVDRGPDLDVERSSQAEAEKKAYDSVGVK